MSSSGRAADPKDEKLAASSQPHIEITVFEAAARTHLQDWVSHDHRNEFAEWHAPMNELDMAA